MAFNAKTVDFGYQARYYSMTLLMTAFAAWCLLRMVRRGRWGDYLLMGFAEALLFHTHQLSAMIFALAALVAVPAVIRHRQWFFKCLGAGAISAGLILPWVWLSGFLATASHIPKANKLFDSFSDWLAYTLNRPDQLALLAGMVLILILGRLKPAWFPARFHAVVREHGQIYLALFAWLVIGYAAFHMVVPAASFFFERLSLILWTPYVLVLAMLTSDLLRGFSPRRAAVLAVVATAGFLAVRGRLAFLENPSVTGSRQGIAAVVEALQKMRPEDGTRFYASPNEHLTLTYYTGLPVQSVAPVRKTFFANTKAPLVFIESEMEWMYPDEADVRFAAAAAGLRVTPDQAQELCALVWTKIVTEELNKDGLPAPPVPTLPDYLDPVVGKMRMQLLEFRVKFMDETKRSPIFRGVSASRMKDFWLGFFYRFANPDGRIGKNLNIFPRLGHSTMELLPAANVVIYHLDP